ncbi:transketolase [Paraliobacillus ryukyuensis]|uniref:Transketolase n=1 Tax=Paraliobacillus ryukyuensis TaxID=200904 RepID=A0A366EDC6_9BACI|nr:transketolase [Paraliobacillus ryukyuensis]RBP00404.1 transketolase [Paraliobacillus ryukyuensis]
MKQAIEQLAVTTIRTLSIDAIEKANSGHPGMPMGAAPMAYTLWTKFMQHNPYNPNWFNRDRFVLSAGHGSMLVYSLLHLSGYDLSMNDIKSFRQWQSKTPGHPEYGHTLGIDATTGPLGQGIGVSVGMAMAEKHLAAKYNRDQYDVVNHYTFAICGDGDLMEGVSSEASSLAGHLGLGKLIVLYDSNDISLDGDLSQSFSENVKERYQAYDWQVLRVEDGNSIEELSQAIELAQANEDQPTLIEVKTTIGFGSPNKSGSSSSHGSPLGVDEAKLTKTYYQWTFDEDFYVPEEVYDHFEEVVKSKGERNEAKWEEKFRKYKSNYPELARELEDNIDCVLPDNWSQSIPVYQPGTSISTRAASGKMINFIAEHIPNLFGGSADLAGSNKTRINKEEDFSKRNYEGKNIWFGVREFGMGTALNGITLHGGLRAFGGTFFVFSDYLRPAIRLAAIMKLPVTYIFTHDSIAVGEDGPTHEPIEQLASLRTMPNLSIIRPADGNETNAAWKLALESKNRPTGLILSRQNLPVLEGTEAHCYENVSKGAYIISPCSNSQADVILLASGSEVSISIEVQKQLKKVDIEASVVSMPSFDLFEMQTETYKNTILPKDVRKRVAIEAASLFGWERYVGLDGKIIGIDTFGASAPGEVLMEKFGFSVDTIVKQIKELF